MSKTKFWLHDGVLCSAVPNVVGEYMSTFVRVPVYFSDRRENRGLGTEHGTQGDAQPHHPAPDHVRRRAHNRHRLQGAREADTAAVRRRKRGRQVPVTGEHVSGCTFRDLFMYTAMTTAGTSPARVSRTTGTPDPGRTWR